ncbi:MAG: DegT/DnrJ/EryC1/StrS family aminotransferase [bacterium]|nr:DegT/DnrJ/EryC1/StrS family aminotransferase [bacterium]
MKIELVNLKRQYNLHRKKISSAVLRVLGSGRYILGSEVEKFEREFADFCRAKHCIGVASGTDALHLSLKALGIKNGDEIITVPNSFVATAMSISMVGAKPVFVDIDPETCNMDVKKITDKITAKTKAIIPVHLYGQPADMDSILKIARRHNLKIIEDACQAHGALYKGRRVGTLGDIGAFSFYPSKNLGGYGDGGAVVTNNDELAKKIFLYRVYGGKDRHTYLAQGLNSRLDAVQAAVLRIKLKHLDRWNKQRAAKVKMYDTLLKKMPIKTISTQPYTQSVHHLYVIRTAHRDSLREYLAHKGISTEIHYPVPIHLQPLYKNLGYRIGNLPVAETAANEIISLPIFPEMENKEIKYITDIIREFFQKP